MLLPALLHHARRVEMGYGKKVTECRERKASPIPFVRTFEVRPSFVLIFLLFLVLFFLSLLPFSLFFSFCGGKVICLYCHLGIA